MSNKAKTRKSVQISGFTHDILKLVSQSQKKPIGAIIDDMVKFKYIEGVK
mgnify:CR=1 FL=1